MQSENQSVPVILSDLRVAHFSQADTFSHINDLSVNIGKLLGEQRS